MGLFEPTELEKKRNLIDGLRAYKNIQNEFLETVERHEAKNDEGIPKGALENRGFGDSFIRGVLNRDLIKNTGTDTMPRYRTTTKGIIIRRGEYDLL